MSMAVLKTISILTHGFCLEKCTVFCIYDCVCIARFSMAFKILRQRSSQVFKSCWMPTHCEINGKYLLCTDIFTTTF